MDLSFVIVNYNTREQLRENLATVSRYLNEPGREAVVIDNHSSDGSAGMAAFEFPNVGLIANPENLGFSAGVNLGLRSTSGRWSLILNSDTLLPAEGLSRLIEFADSEFEAGKAAIIGVRLLNQDGSLQYSKGPFPSIARTLADVLKPRTRRKYSTRGYMSAGETDWVTGACVLVRREFLEEVGLLDENFFLYYEDVDLCWQARHRGWKVVYYPGFAVRHRNPHAGRPVNPEFVPVEIRRSHLYYYRKNYSRLSFSALWMLTFFWAAGGWFSFGIPSFLSNGRLFRSSRVHRRVLKEVLFNGKLNGIPHRPPDAG